MIKRNGRAAYMKSQAQKRAKTKSALKKATPKYKQTTKAIASMPSKPKTRTRTRRRRR